MTTTNYEVGDPDVALVERLFSLQSPRTPAIGELLDRVRGAYQEVASGVLELPRTAERTLALRKLHDACQATITAVVMHQDAILEAQGPPG